MEGVGERGGLGQCPYLRRAWQKRGGKIDTLMHAHYAYTNFHMKILNNFQEIEENTLK